MNAVFPKITFKQMPLELEVEMFSEFLKTTWSQSITDKYPAFLNILKIKSGNDRETGIRNEIVRIRADLGEKLNTSLEAISSDWQKVEERVLKTLSDIIQEDWPEKEITAYISINPVCPRFLDSWSFSVYHDHKQPTMVIAHEISHFLYFRKFKKLFPEIDDNKYESPHKEWILSEIIAVIMLGDKWMLEALSLSARPDFYAEHLKLKINDQPLTEIVKKLYTEYVVQDNNFAEFTKMASGLLKELR